MTRLQVSVSSLLIAAFCSATAWVGAFESGSSALQPASASSLDRLRGADNQFSVNQNGDCESNEAARENEPVCGSCTEQQAVAGATCVCCTGGSAANLQQAPPGQAGQYTGVNPNASQFDCGKITYYLCVNDGGKVGCTGPNQATQNSCGTVAEYAVQEPAPPPPF